MKKRLILSIILISCCSSLLAQSIDMELYLFQNICENGAYEIFRSNKKGFRNVGNLEKDSDVSILYSKYDNGIFLKSWITLTDSVYIYSENTFDYSKPIFIPYNCFFSSVTYHSITQLESLDTMKDIRSYISGSLCYRVKSDTLKQGKHLLSIGLYFKPELVAYDISEFYSLKSNLKVISVEFGIENVMRYLIIDCVSKRLIIFADKKELDDFIGKPKSNVLGADQTLKTFKVSTLINCEPWSIDIKRKRRKCYSNRTILR